MPFTRRQHLRTNSNGRTFSVREHHVSRSAYRAFTYRSITIPDAKCPVCSVSVFYYENSFGSKVFFDELGPPWPKHPCTSDSAVFNPSNAHIFSKPYDWQVLGWEPVFNLEFQGKFKSIHSNKTWRLYEGEIGSHRIKRDFFIEEARFDLSHIVSPLYFKTENDKGFFDFLGKPSKRGAFPSHNKIFVHTNSWNSCKLIDCTYKKEQRIIIFRVKIPSGKIYFFKVHGSKKNIHYNYNFDFIRLSKDEYIFRMKTHGALPSYHSGALVTEED